MANEKILVVDDDKNICELLRLYLVKEGYNVTMAHDGAAALAEFDKLHPDLVLLDPPFHNGTLENILPIVDKCVAPGGIVICESETKLVLPAEVGGLQLKKQYKYGKVLLWKYVRPMADAAEEEGEA